MKKRCIDKIIPNFMCIDVPLGVYSKTALDIVDAVLLPHDETMIGDTCYVSPTEICYESSKYFIRYGNPFGKAVLSRIYDNNHTLKYARAALSETGEVVVRELMSLKGYDAGHIELLQQTNEVTSGLRKFLLNAFLNSLSYVCSQLDTALNGEEEPFLTFYSRDSSKQVSFRFAYRDMLVLREFIKWSNVIISSYEETTGPKYKEIWTEIIGSQRVDPLLEAELRLFRMKWGNIFIDVLKTSKGLSTMKTYNKLTKAVKPLVKQYKVDRAVLEDEMFRESMLINSIIAKSSNS
jgi:hypothetical protein